MWRKYYFNFSLGKKGTEQNKQTNKQTSKQEPLRLTHSCRLELTASQSSLQDIVMAPQHLPSMFWVQVRKSTISGLFEKQKNE